MGIFVVSQGAGAVRASGRRANCLPPCGSLGEIDGMLRPAQPGRAGGLPSRRLARPVRTCFGCLGRVAWADVMPLRGDANEGFCGLIGPYLRRRWLMLVDVRRCWGMRFVPVLYPGTAAPKHAMASMDAVELQMLSTTQGVVRWLPQSRWRRSAACASAEPGDGLDEQVVEALAGDEDCDRRRWDCWCCPGRSAGRSARRRRGSHRPVVSGLGD